MVAPRPATSAIAKVAQRGAAVQDRPDGGGRLRAANGGEGTGPPSRTVVTVGVGEGRVDARRRLAPPESLPPDLRSATGARRWRLAAVGGVGVRTFRLEVEHQPAQYLKIAARETYPSLADERERLVWLGGRLPVPRVLHFAADAAQEYLLLLEIAGVPASDPSHGNDLPGLVRLLAAGLRQIHGLDSAGCPFDRRLRVTLGEVRDRLAAGAPTAKPFAGPLGRREVQSLDDELPATWPVDEDVVFTHGDYCLPNVMIDVAGGAVTGFIDWGRGGLADRHQDLALAARSLTRNFGERWVPPFFASYGPDRIDRRKIMFYQLLDQFY